MKRLIKRLEKAKGPNFALEQEIMWAVRRVKLTHRSPNDKPPAYTCSVDAAMSLLPPTAVNHNLFSFGGHGEKHITGHAWAFQFHDTAQLVGAERAKAEVKRLRMGAASGSTLRTVPKEIFEKAIAQQFMQFYASHAANPAIAVCIAALKATCCDSSEHAPRQGDA